MLNFASWMILDKRRQKSSVNCLVLFNVIYIESRRSFIYPWLTKQFIVSNRLYRVITKLTQMILILKYQFCPFLDVLKLTLQGILAQGIWLFVLGARFSRNMIILLRLSDAVSKVTFLALFNTEKNQKCNFRFGIS